MIANPRFAACHGGESQWVRIRAAERTELPLPQEIERSAGQSFRDIGMPEIADDDPFPLGELAAYQRAGLAWVAVDDQDRPVAYLLTAHVDGNVHVEQVSVHSDSAHRRIGRMLLEHAADQAGAEGAPALTLTTFAQVPWNAPYYLTCGFQLLAEDAAGPGLRAIRAREAAGGLDRWPRVGMRRSL